VKSKKLNETIA